MATNKLIDLSRLSRFWDKVKNYIDSKITNLPAAQGGTDNTLVTTGDKYNWNNNDASNKVSKSGDTMTGRLYTSFNSAVAMGTYGAQANTIPDLCDELRFSSGCGGSANITTEYNNNSITIPTGWYNFLWIPHRSGGDSGEASGDNCNYGMCILTGMTVNGAYRIKYSNANIYVAYLDDGVADYWTTGTTTKIKIKINSTAAWMLAFVVTLYQGYRATRVFISGYNYGSNYWYDPSARLLGDTDNNERIKVYFGYDSANNLWVGFDGGNYTGVHIDSICNGYHQVNRGALFTITNVSDFGGTTQTTASPITRAYHASEADTATTAGNVTGTVAIANGGTGATTKANAGTNLGFNWSGKTTMPYWIWGGDSQGAYYVYRPYTICGLTLSGTTTNYTAKNFTISGATELVIVCRYSSKIFSTSVPYNTSIIGTSNQELWVGGGKGSSSAATGDAARCLCNIKLSGTTFTLQGVSCTNEGTMVQSGITWYVYYR